MEKILRVLNYVTRVWMPFGIMSLFACIGWASPAIAYDWKIDGISVKPNQSPYYEGDVLTIECTWSRSGSPSDEASGFVRIFRWYKGAPKYFTIKEIKLTPSSSGGTMNAQWVAQQDNYEQTIACEVGFGAAKDPQLYHSKEPDYANNKKSVVVYVSKKIQQTKWPTAPFIVTPGQNQKVLAPVKILVKPRDPDKKCTDNGVLSLSKEMKGSKKLSAAIPTKNCKPEGAIWELDLVLGVYQIKAKHTNNKYNFASDWSDWVTFEVVK